MVLINVRKNVEKILNKIHHRREPEILMRNCIQNKETTNLADLNRVALCILGPVHAKKMVKILFKGLNSKDYSVFCNTINTFEFLLKFAELYPTFTLEFKQFCGQNYKRVWKNDNDLHVKMRLYRIDQNSSKPKDVYSSNTFKEILASRYTNLILNLRKIALETQNDEISVLNTGDL